MAAKANVLCHFNAPVSCTDLSEDGVVREPLVVADLTRLGVVRAAAVELVDGGNALRVAVVQFRVQVVRLQKMCVASTSNQAFLKMTH